MAKKQNVLVVSAAGFGNVGDDIISLMAGALFKYLNPRADLKFADLKFYYDELEWADVVVLAGGGVLYDSSPANVENYLRFIDHAKLRRKKTVALSIGTQGITTEYGKRRYRESLSLLDLLIVRDEEDARVLSALGITRPIYTTTDSTFLLPQMATFMKNLYKYEEPAALRELKQIRESLRKGQRLVGLSLSAEDAGLDVDKEGNRNINYKRAHDDEIRFISSLADDKQNKVVLFLQSKDDEEFYKELLSKNKKLQYLKLEKQQDSLALFDIYSLFDIVVTSRFHGFIASVLAERPTYFIKGVNAGKTIRTIEAHLPSLKENVIPVNDVRKLQTKLTTKVSREQADERNTLIVKAQVTLDYLRSLLAE